jgi:hypothetical protein
VWRYVTLKNIHPIASIKFNIIYTGKLKLEKMKNLKAKTSKLDSFEEKEVKDLNTLGGAAAAGPGVSVTLHWDGWGDGSFFCSLFDGVRGVDVNEFDEA